MADTNLYDPDTGTPLIGRWPLDMALQHARDHDHATAGYDSHMRAALRAIDLLEAELRRQATPRTGLGGDPVSTIRTAADTIRTLVGALPERARSEWACDRGIVWAPRGTPIAQALAWRDDADRHAIGALIATVARPDVAAALADLLHALAWWREAITSGDDMGVAVAVNRVHAAGDSLADAITRREQQ